MFAGGAGESKFQIGESKISPFLFQQRSPVPCGFEADAGEEVKLTPVSRAGLGAYHDLGREGVEAAAAGGEADAGEEVRVAEVRAEVFQSKIQGNTQPCTILFQFLEFCLYMGNLEFRNYVVVNDVP